MRSFSRSTSESKRGGRTVTAGAALATTAALVAALFSATPALAATTASHPEKLPSLSDVKNTVSNFKDGKYIVTLKDAPVATYAGTLSKFAATKPKAGEQLDVKATAVKKYSAYLEGKQKDIASQLGVKPLYNYTVASNGFAASLTAEEAARLAKSSLVAHVTPNEMLKIQAQSSTDFLKVSTAGGVWDKLGGVANAGKGIVVGDLDTGIAPENPSFAGDPLGTAASTNKPWTSGGSVFFVKADGDTFSNTPNLGDDHFASTDLSTKIIGADYFVEGVGVDNIGGNDVGEYLSPRDGDSHGSHTASTAAGNYNVSATVHNDATDTDVDFGKISGVAPAAKIAAYKVCWSGKYPDLTTDDGCATTDIVAAIDQAVADGVDVINFSIGGGAAQTTYSPSDAAFMNAAAAGIFVSASAGNSGPTATTLDNASPWETTVAASTIPSYEATATLGNGKKYAGASITVDRGTDPITDEPFVDAKNVAAAGDAGAQASLCGPGTLDPTKVAGKVVLCDRGVFDRVAKSKAVADAGGIGVVMVNQVGGANDVDLDEHSVPTIHVSNTEYNALHTYAAPGTGTVTFTDGNSTTTQTPVPQVAGFSSRGPVAAAGGDVLKPDISAPGVSILAAATNLARTPAFEFLSGTSMAAPHITGLAALYLSVHPLATPMEIKSAMMTTAANTVGETGKAETDPFAQGAGEVTPSKFLSPGLLYLSDVSDWKQYLVGAGEATFTGVTGIDPSNLNSASIAVGDLVKKQTVTRSVTSTGTGSYKATVKVPGVVSTVSPSTLKFTKAGQTKSFTVTFTRSTAKLDAFSTGFLTWKKVSGTTVVRSPIAIHPTSVQAPETVNGTGTSGKTSVAITAGANGSIPIDPYGLAEGVLSTPKGEGAGEYSDTAVTGGHYTATHEVLAGSDLVRFDVQPLVEDVGTDLDLYVFYFETAADVPADPNLDDLLDNGDLVGQSATASGHETVDVYGPDAGFYLAYTDFFSAPAGGAKFRDTFYQLNPETNVGNLTAIPATIAGKTGVTSNFDLRWGGLTPNRKYLGYIFYGKDGAAEDFTSVFITTGDALAPVSVTKPTITGTPAVGETLTADPGTWDAKNDVLTFSYQWLADGDAIEGATDATYEVAEGDAGKKISVIVTARLGEDGPPKVVASAAVTVKASSTTAIALEQNPITTKQQAVVTVTVTTNPVGNAVGTVTVYYGTKSSKIVKLTAAANGVVKVTLPKLSKKSHPVRAEFTGGATAGSSVSDTETIVVQ